MRAHLFKPKGYCLKCQQNIFYLELPGVSRQWWHEDYDLDFNHAAKPRPQDLKAAEKLNTLEVCSD